MSFTLPDLDVIQANPTLDRLVRRISGYAPGWTDHNPSDPGIALLQMLVWIAEGTSYTANAVPFETYRNMLRWIVGLSSALSLPLDPQYAKSFPYAEYADTKSQDPTYESLKETLAQMDLGASLDYAALQAAVVGFRTAPFLAITPSDLVALATELNAFIDAQTEQGRTALHVARVCLQPHGDVTEMIVVSDAAYTYSDQIDEGDGTFSISLTSPIDDSSSVQQERALLDNVWQYLAARTPLGCGISIGKARLFYLDVQCQVRCFARERVDEVAAAVLSALQRALQPIRTDGGRDSTYGVRIDATALLPVVGASPGVDAVESLTIELFGRPHLHGVAPASAAACEGGLPRLHRARVTALEAEDD